MKKPEFTKEELHDLLDMLQLIYVPDIKLNKLTESYFSVLRKLEDYCIPEIRKRRG